MADSTLDQPKEGSNQFSYQDRATGTGDSSDNIKRLVGPAKENLSKFPDNDEIKTQLEIIENLKLCIIPRNTPPTHYYSISGSGGPGGATEKTALIDEKALIAKLDKLAKIKDVSELAQNKIRANAILKHPKADKETEVQREAIGLAIAKTLGFSDVTENIMVNHDTGNGIQPCLFVPFGDMDELTNSIDAPTTSKGRLKADEFDSVEDFGKYSAFFALCSDPDFIGKNGQNKGLTNDNKFPRRLYIFDQVFMHWNNLSLDRSFNLVPTSAGSLSRHHMGRNKSVINDSSFEEKIGGAIHVLKKRDDIQKVFDNAKTANSSIPLKTDAWKCSISFNNRIRGIEKIFPSIKVDENRKRVCELNDDQASLLKKSMLVTQMLNKPKLFDKNGKPYRAPFFTNPSTRVKEVSIEGNNVVISFSRGFSRPLSENKKTLLKDQGFKILDDGRASIHKDDLKKLNEKSYFKVQEDTINLNYNYFDKTTIEALAKNYREDNCNVGAILNIKNISELDIIPFKNQGLKAHIEQCYLYNEMKNIIVSNPGQEYNLQKRFTKEKSSGNLRYSVENLVVNEDEKLKTRIELDYSLKNKLKEIEEQELESNKTKPEVVSVPTGPGLRG